LPARNAGASKGLLHTRVSADNGPGANRIPS
jgi:hypothetical protein